MADEELLDPAVEALVLPELRADRCIDGWTVVPTGDLVVFLIDRDLQQAVAPFLAAAGRPRLGFGDTLVFQQQGGRWERISAGSWGVGPEKLLRTFEVAAREQPRPTWSAGVHLCRRWIAWYSHPATQAEVDEVLTELDAEPAPGPVWREMRRQFSRWAGLRGFVVRATPRSVWSRGDS